jgi:hypothetical protein
MNNEFPNMLVVSSLIKTRRLLRKANLCVAYLPTIHVVSKTAPTSKAEKDLRASVHP